jgi:type IX secretion system PorP/SprF family membrane protein
MKTYKMKYAAFSVSCLLLLFMQRTAAQTDPHFTQNYTYPMYVNPALAGSGNGDYRVAAIYRSQWGGVGNPYRTTGVSFDTRTTKNINLGVSLMNQSAGDGGFNYLNSYATIAYTGVKFGKTLEHRLVFALQPGIINRRIDQSKFKWGEQWNPITGYNASNPTSESFLANAATTFDIGAGVLYYDASEDKKYNVFGGASFFHLNAPKDPIVSSESDVLNTIPLRFTVHGGVSFSIMEGTSIVPHLLYMQQGNARETMVGVYAQKNVNEETDIMFGGYYRHNDAFAPFVGVDYRDFLIGLSYDMNTSDLGSMSRNINSFELSLSYNPKKGAKGIFDFIRCPRL